MTIGKIKISLTPAQENHFNTAVWLLDNDRNLRTGRSTVLAAAYIMIATHNPYRWYKVQDHSPIKQCDQELFKSIQVIIGHNGREISELFDYKENSLEFRFTGWTTEFKKNTRYKIISLSPHLKNMFGSKLKEGFLLEDNTTVVFGTSWMNMNGSPACMIYGMRGGLERLPTDNKVYYGKIGGCGVLLHESEIGDPLKEEKSGKKQK